MTSSRLESKNKFEKKQKKNTTTRKQRVKNVKVRNSALKALQTVKQPTQEKVSSKCSLVAPDLGLADLQLLEVKGQRQQQVAEVLTGEGEGVVGRGLWRGRVQRRR